MSVRPRWDQLVYRPNEIADQVDDVDDLDDTAAAAALHQHALDQIRRTELHPPTPAYAPASSGTSRPGAASPPTTPAPPPPTTSRPAPATAPCSRCRTAPLPPTRCDIRSKIFQAYVTPHS